MHRKKISDVYSAEVAGEFTTKLALLRWTNGSSNLAFADRWHYDGFWFTIGTTLFGEGTNYSLADRHQEARWAQGFFPNHEISESSVAPALASIIYTARDRAMFYQAKSQTMPPLLHKGSEKFQPRLFLVQSLR